ncbi:cytochrome P450 [Polyporus arcularius HHB13444]|uniref:Cytochrome P450 n=1 Tax=Polyporus arcularius HHB13444 TaxID=1314778 RepID=A0A5C3NXS1_9APHY|nr:cytochrome P450 [Polyporus arcularius HHB13444]
MAATFDPWLAALLAALVLVVVVSLNKRRRSLPPGPKGLPIFGNVFDVPKEFEWLAYDRWSRECHSDVIYLNLAGTPAIVVNSAQAAHELFEKRSSLYSDRARMPMLNELVGCDWHFVFMGYGEDWRERRRVFHQYFHPNATKNYRPRELKVARELLRRLLESPDDFMVHLRHMAGSLILGVAYGIDVQPNNDPYIATAETALHAMSMAGNAGAYLVDYIPILKHIPSWLPGATFKRQAAEWKKATDAMVERPFKAVRTAMAEGKATPSMILSLLSEADDSEDKQRKETVISGVAAAAYTGGSDTTVSALGSFFLAMVLYPEIQRKAQAEVDRVIGRDRLPDFSDEPSIPYVTALVKEVLRWRPVTPLAVPHRLTADDVYNGYHLPAGSIVVGNSWAMLHDEKTFYEPEEFIPERWLNEDGSLREEMRDAELAAFGFGRRICPGRHLAAGSIWIGIASVLTCFDLAKPVDKDGKVIEPSGEYISGLVTYPRPFQCVFKPRSDSTAKLIYAGLQGCE